MQKVTKAYKTSMKSALRERAYIMISFGLVNQEAQAKASIAEGSFAYYSNKENLFGEHDTSLAYATLEEDFCKADGSMIFLPRQTSATRFTDTGLVGKDLVSEAQSEVQINLNTIATDFRGLTIYFGEDYPVDFDVVSDTGQVAEFRDNTEAVWSTEEVFENTVSLRLIVYKMLHEQSRLRIYRIRFGYGLVYYNDSVMDSRLESYASPIGEDVPQVDFSVTLKNYDHYFNVDNPDSAINFLETGQEMDILYGYATPGADAIEWIQGQHLLCSEWESDDNTATIRCQDVFRNMDGEYTKGLYSAGGKSYYTLAEEILADAGVTEYYLDPRLKTLYTNNPMPRVKHKEALQIIANACRCSLSQSRYGKIEIRSSFVPQMTASANAETAYSDVSGILDDDAKGEYATLAKDYTQVDGGMYFVPKTGAASVEAGFVSGAISDENGAFAENPVVTIKMEAIRAYYALSLTFGTNLPAAFTIQTYSGGTAVNEYEIGEDEIDSECVIVRDFDDCDEMRLIFTKTAVGYNRITLHRFSLSEVADFTMTRRDMTSSPTAIKQELVKEVTVPCYTYQENSHIENLVNEEVTVAAGDVVTYYIQDPSYGYTPLLDEASGGATVTDWGNYYVTLKYSVTGTYRLEVQGYRYKIVERYATVTLHAKGKTVKWQNPLVSSMEMASDLAEWLGDHYKSGIEYEYDTRGNPEIDATDIVYQENEFRDHMKVQINRHVITFKQTYSGSVTARRIGV